MSELNQSSDTVKNQKENLSQNISFFIQDIFQDTSPFHQQLKHFY